MRSFVLPVLSVMTLALACAGSERRTVEVKCFYWTRDLAKTQSVTWYWYEGTSRAGVLHPARVITNDRATSIPGVSGYQVNDSNSSLTLKFDRCDVTVDLQCAFLDGENTRHRYMFKVSGCAVYRTAGPSSPARNGTKHVDAVEFTFHCFGDKEKRHADALPASWYWNLEDEAHARRPAVRRDPVLESVRAHGSHNEILTLRLKSCDVTVDIQCLVHKLRNYSAWTHFRLENCYPFSVGFTDEGTYRVMTRERFWSPDRRLDLQCPDAYPERTSLIVWGYLSPRDGSVRMLGGEVAVPALTEHSVDRDTLMVRFKNCDSLPARFVCIVDRGVFIFTWHAVTVKYCAVFQHYTKTTVPRNKTGLDLRCGDPRPQEALRVLWYREQGDGTRPVKPNSTLPGVSEHGVDLFTGELTLLFADCEKSFYLQCALSRSGVEESRHRYEVRGCAASHLGLAVRSESGGDTDAERGNASHVRLYCPGARKDNAIDVSWVPEGNWTLPVAARLTDSTGELVLVCDHRLRFLQCVHVGTRGGTVRHRFQLNDCNASYLGVVRDDNPPAPTTVFHYTVPVIGKVKSFPVTNCTSPTDGEKGQASIPTSSSSERTRFWLVVLVSAAVFAGYPVS